MRACAGHAPEIWQSNEPIELLNPFGSEKLTLTNVWTVSERARETTTAGRAAGSQGAVRKRKARCVEMKARAVDPHTLLSACARGSKQGIFDAREIGAE